MPERLTKEQAAACDEYAALCAQPTYELHHRERLLLKLSALLGGPIYDVDTALAIRSAALLARAEQAEQERDALRDILERLHSVQDGCPLHRHNTVWVKAMEDAQAAFDRAGGGA